MKSIVLEVIVREQYTAQASIADAGNHGETADSVRFRPAGKCRGALLVCDTSSSFKGSHKESFAQDGSKFWLGLCYSVAVERNQPNRCQRQHLSRRFFDLAGNLFLIETGCNGARNTIQAV